MTKRRYRVLAAVTAMLALGVVNASAAVVLIANPDTHVSTVDARTVRNLFLGRASRIDGAGRVTIATLAGGKVHETFVREFLDKTPDQFSRYWLRLVFSGKASRPEVFESERDLADYVARTPGAIGYVSSDTPVQGVTVIRVEKK